MVAHAACLCDLFRPDMHVTATLSTRAGPRALCSFVLRPSFTSPRLGIDGALRGAASARAGAAHALCRPQEEGRGRFSAASSCSPAQGSILSCDTCATRCPELSSVLLSEGGEGKRNSAKESEEKEQGRTDRGQEARGRGRGRGGGGARGGERGAGEERAGQGGAGHERVCDEGAGAAARGWRVPSSSFPLLLGLSPLLSCLGLLCSVGAILLFSSPLLLYLALLCSDATSILADRHRLRSPRRTYAV